jgi:hypothetical protein
MSIRKKIRNALAAVFPTIESFAGFVEDSQSRQRLQSFIDLAARHDLIDSADSHAFEAFILANRCSLSRETADRLTMEELINNKDEYLNIKISNRALTDKINLLLSKHGILLPPLSSAMLTRLKKQAADTPRKRDALRSLAFWIGHERDDQGQKWHYETLKKICCDDVQKTVNAAFGVRIAFSIDGRGHVISRDIILWLKRTIKKILSENRNTFFDEMSVKVKIYDLTTFYVDLPNQDVSAIPAAYGHTLKEAIAIAHHLSINWMISGFANYGRFCFVGIAAGDFSELSVQVQAALNAKLPDDPVIRLTNYARQCVMINEIRVLLNPMPKEVEIVNNQTTKVWWITEQSNILYWDITPAMLSVGHLNEVKTPYLERKRPLRLQSTENTPSGGDERISLFMNYPHHSMLGFEIARTLFCTKRLPEAVEILHVLLRINPDHISSRVMLMMIFKIFAVEAPNYRLADTMFRRAEKEAQYITTNFIHTDEDFYYEYAVLKLARLSVGIKVLRKHPDGRVAKDLRVVPADLLALADAAEEILMQGMSVSLSAKRIYRLFFSVHILKFILAENLDANGLFLPRLTCPKHKIKQYLLEVVISAAQYQKSSPNMADAATFNRFITDQMRRYERSVALDIFKPTLHFSNAIFFWDLIPVRNVAFVLSTLKELKSGLKAAKLHAQKKELIFSDVAMTGQIVPAEAFMAQINAIIEEIEERYKKAPELEKMDPAQEIGSDTDDLVLMTYHV